MKRKVEYLPNGTPMLASPSDLITCWRQHTERIPATYALGTAQHEADYALNERDTEPSGYVSMGIFQLGDEELASAGVMPINHEATGAVYTLETSCRVFARITEERYDRIAQQLGQCPREPDIWAYLVISHNQGIGACLKTIRRYGLDWEAYKTRNPQLASLAAYGNDAISGGIYGRLATPAPFA